MIIMIVKVLIFGVKFIEIVYGWLGMLFKFYNEFHIQIVRSDIAFLIKFFDFLLFLK